MTAVRNLLLLASCIHFSCVPQTPHPTPRLLKVYATPAARAWLPDLYACAGESAPSTALVRVDDPSAADLVLRLGEPAFLVSPAFQIDTEQILLAAHRESPVQDLTLEQARALFAGDGEQDVQVWVYPEGADLQEIFHAEVMGGGNVRPSARLAADPQSLARMLAADRSAVGILPLHSKGGELRAVLEVATVPVLAITQAGPEGVTRMLIACLQG